MHTVSRPGAKTVAIIGGGVSGALTAFHLRKNLKDVRIVVIDPRPELGLGLAYSTPSMRHLLNVPAGKISALPAEPGHFLEWLRNTVDSEATEATFAPRAVFGPYIRAVFSKASNIEQLQAEVIDLGVDSDTATLKLKDGGLLTADYVVLATGNFDPAALPGIEVAAVESGVYCHNAWSEATYASLPKDASVTLIGTGLTGIDVVLRLREVGHTGPITAVSRHGVFPNRHAACRMAVCSAIPANTAATCVSYLRALRAAIARGIEWRSAIDNLRSTTNDLWLALPLKEQKRFRRHLQRRWDVVRHRMAPPVADIIERELAAGTLRMAKGHLVGVSLAADGARVTLRTAEGPSETHAARVINCTGPGMNYRRVASPLLQSLFAQGLAASGPLGGGLNTTRYGALLDGQGQASSLLFNLGPGRLGTLLESIAIPEIRQQAVELAVILDGRLRRQVAASRIQLQPASQLLSSAAV